MENKSQFHILVVDDDCFLRESICAYLEDCRFTVYEADSGQQALALFHEQQPNLVLLDLRMPDMDGMQLLPKLVTEVPNMPVIIISGQGTMDDAIQALRFGAWDYLMKPIHDFALLDHAIQRAMERAALLQTISDNQKYLEHEVLRRTEELNLANKSLLMLSRCNEMLIHAEHESSLLQGVCSTIIENGDYLGAWVGYLDDCRQKLQLKASHGCAKELLDSCLSMQHITGKEGISSIQSVFKGRYMIIPDTDKGTHCGDYCNALFHQLGVHAIGYFPLITEGESFGVLTIYASDGGRFTDSEIKLLEELANDLAFGITSIRIKLEREQVIAERSEWAAKTQKSMIKTIQAIAMTLEKRDPYTAGHQQRVSVIAGAIANELGWDQERIQGLQLGAMIHDIGKVYVPAEILNRPGRLTAEEFAIMRTHPQVGYEIIKEIEFPWPLAQMVHQHHERLDGSGYPQGLKGDEIIMEARILIVADVVEAITSHRPYRAGHSIDVALDEIGQNRGILYEAEVVDACVSLITEGRLQLEGWV